MNTATLHSALPDVAAGAAPPEWVHLMPAGTFAGVDGRGPYHLRDPQAVIAASMEGGKLAVDENHATDYAMKTGQPSPARGWITEMQMRPDGIWGRVTWTPSGVQLMSEGAYRGISPVFGLDLKTNVVTRILRAALTNTPNLGALPTLHSQEDLMDPKALRAALGLPETADDAAVLARIQQNQAAITQHAQQLAAIATAAGVTTAGTPTADGLVTVLASQRAAAGDTQRLANTVIELQTQLGTLQASAARTAAEAAIDAAIAAGKPIAALRDHFITRHMADPKSVATELAGLPSLHAGGIGGQQLVVLNAMGDGDADWTPQEKMACQKMGVSKEAFLKQKKKDREKEAA